MSQVRVMRWQEPLTMDTELLAGLFVDMGEARAADALICAMEQLSDAVNAVRDDIETARFVRAAKGLDEVARIADPLGFVSLAQVAKALQVQLYGRDTVAIAAISARLLRLRDRTLKLVWDMQDKSG